MQGPWVQSLVGELRSCKLHGAAKKKKKIWIILYKLLYLCQLSNTLWKFLQVVRCSSNSFYLINGCGSRHFSVDGCSLDILVHMSLFINTFIFTGQIPRSGIAGCRIYILQILMISLQMKYKSSHFIQQLSDIFNIQFFSPNNCDNYELGVINSLLLCKGSMLNFVLNFIKVQKIPLF